MNKIAIFTTMNIDRQIVFKELRQLVLFAVISSGQAYLSCPRCSNSPRSFAMAWTIAFVMWLVLWKGNSIIARLISKRVSWIEFPLKRFLLGITGTVAFTLLSVWLLMKFFELIFSMSFGKDFTGTMYFSVVVAILISFFLHARQFLLSWRQATLDKEKFEKESIAARYESLKNQVNPHFLFNSLNALSNLVYEDQDKAVKFIKQLSEVYRYVLDTREQEVVPVSQELKFLESYLFLQQIRFGDKLIIHNELKDERFYVTPLALQLLLENAIKHNVISQDEKLTIRLYREGDYTFVENNLQKKRIPLEDSAGVGLENIQRRYGLLTDKPVIIEQREGKFIVRLPVITKNNI